MNQVEKIIYTGKTHTTGGREGYAKSDDGRLDTKLSPPGSQAAGTNPEQLFAAGWSACFIGAMGRAAKELNVTVPADVAVDAEVDLCSGEGGFFLQARLNVSLPGLPRDKAEAVIEAANRICPYSKLSRGNINATVSLV